MELIFYVNLLFEIWIDAKWYIALLMSAAVNVSVFLLTAFVLDKLIFILIEKYSVGRYIDDSALKLNQKKVEIRNGIIACLVFALGSLLTRELFVEIWPQSFSVLVYQILAFSIFYETYSYFIHRLLHHKIFSTIHGSHHKSIRVTPWSAYSVHPIEAMFIGFSAPIYMSLFSMSLGVALIFHIIGMVFTIFIHSNFGIDSKKMIVSIVADYPKYHSLHHTTGNKNFGFVNTFWDQVFKTKSKSYTRE